MGKEARFTSDVRTPGEASWSSDEDWLAGDGTATEVDNGEIESAVSGEPTQEMNRPNHTNDLIYDTKFQIYIPAAPYPSGQRRVEVMVTQKVNLGPDESLRIEGGLVSEDGADNVYDKVSASVIFGPGTRAGTTKVAETTGELSRSDSWSVFSTAHAAPTTASRPDDLKLDIWVGVY